MYGNSALVCISAPMVLIPRFRWHTHKKSISVVTLLRIVLQRSGEHNPQPTQKVIKHLDPP